MSDVEITMVAEWDETPHALWLIDAVHRGHHLRKSYRKTQRRRKLRLYCCAMARMLWSRLASREREAVEAAERFADDYEFGHKARRATERERHSLAFRECFVYSHEFREEYRTRRQQRVVGNCLAPNGRLQEAAHFAICGRRRTQSASRCGWNRRPTRRPSGSSASTRSGRPPPT